MNTNIKLRGGLLAAASVLGLAFAMPAAAQTDQQRLDALEAQIGALQAELAALRAQPAPAAAAPSGNTAAVTLSPSPRYTSADGNFTFRPRGRVEFDVAAFDVDVPAGSPEFNSGTQFRRARLGVDGRLASVWGYRFEVDLAGSSVSIADAYVQYLGFDGVTVTIGQHKTPTSLERLTGSPALLFLERGTAVETFTNAGEAGGDRRLGVSAGIGGSNWTLTAGAFGEPLDRTAGAAGTSEGWGVYGRGTIAPVNTDTTLIHLGASAFWRDTGSVGQVRFRDRPEVRVDNRRIIDTGVIDADSQSFIGLEAIGSFGSAFLLGEYTRVSVDRLPVGGVAQPDVDFDGFYIAGGFFLTGERLPYSNGILGAVRPNNPLTSGGAGAWAITARYSNIDLDDANILGGETQNYTLGLNWHPVQNVRATFNYIHFDSERGGVSLDGNVFGARLGVDW